MDRGSGVGNFRIRFLGCLARGVASLESLASEDWILEGLREVVVDRLLVPKLCEAVLLRSGLECPYEVEPFVRPLGVSVWGES